MRGLLQTTRSVLLAGVAAGAVAFGAAAGPVTVGDGWVAFSFGGVGSGFSQEPFTFTLAGPGVLTVTDAFQAGDQFEIFDNLVSIGLTSLPTGLGEQVSNDYDTAAADPLWSTGVFALAAGTYSITGLTVLSPFGGGGAALRVDQTAAAVPAPMALGLFGIGLLGLAVARRRA